jgi:hypothetical protein
VEGGGVSPRVKRPGRDADHSASSSAVVGNDWSRTFTFPVCLHGVDRDFIVTFYGFRVILRINFVFNEWVFVVRSYCILDEFCRLLGELGARKG